MTESRVLEIRPASTRGTLLTVLLPTLGAARVACSESRLAGILGHAFTFSMARGGGEVWQLANMLLLPRARPSSAALLPSGCEIQIPA